MTDPGPALALKCVRQLVSYSVSPETFLTLNISEPTEANELKLGGYANFGLKSGSS